MLAIEMILSGRQFALCIFLGIVLGVGMIITRTAPGLAEPDNAPNTPARRDAVRQADMQTLAAALTKYKSDHGSLPVKFSPADTPICSSVGQNCLTKHFADISFLLTGGSYLQAIPMDPDNRTLWSSGYTISELPDGQIKLAAPNAERSTISVIR